jgi:GLPGLI family protein
MKTIFYIIVLLSSNLFFSQKLHVQYSNKNSKFTTFLEDLYIMNSDIVSVRSSDVKNSFDEKEANNSGNNQSIYFTKDKIYKIIYYKKSVNKIIINDYIGDTSFIIEDNLPQINWNTNYSETKNISGYLCKKATAEFRGSKITAYYSENLQFSTGPYKFGGLNGLILEITEDDKDFNSWIAIKVETNFNDEIPSLPENENIVSLKHFIELKDKKREDDFTKIISKAPSGTIITRHKLKRDGIEKIYEWE